MLTKTRSAGYGIVLLAVVAAFVMLSAGCGGEAATSSTAAESRAGDANAATGASGGEIPIGILSSYSGELAIAGPLFQGAMTLAVDDVNGAGGVLGKQLKLYVEDDRSLPEEAVKAAQKLINVNRVVSVNGLMSESVLAVYPVASDAKVMVTSPCAGTVRVNGYGGNYVYRTIPMDDEFGEALAQNIIDRGYKKVALVYQSQESTESQLQTSKPFFEAAGVEITVEVPLEGGQSTYSAELKKVADSKPEVVFLSAGAATDTIIVKEAKQKGYFWDWLVTNEVMDSSVMSATGADALEGIICLVMGTGDSPSYDEWVARFTAAGNELTGLYETNAYDAIIIQALAMIKGGEASGEAINANYVDVSSPPGEVVYSFAEGAEALKAGKDIDYYGVSGPCDFDEYGATPGSYTEMLFEGGEWIQGKSFYVKGD